MQSELIHSSIWADWSPPKDKSPPAEVLEGQVRKYHSDITFSVSSQWGINKAHSQIH